MTTFEGTITGELWMGGQGALDVALPIPDGADPQTVIRQALAQAGDFQPGTCAIHGRVVTHTATRGLTLTIEEPTQ